MNNTEVISDVINAFKNRGFEFVGKADDGWFKIRGGLVPIPSKADKSYLCEVEIDPAFIDLPRIRMLEIPHELPPVAPHLGPYGGLCYLEKGTVVLDIYDPVGQSLACLERAKAVLGQIINGEMVEDLTEEFFAYWRGGFCFTDIQDSKLGQQDCIVAEVNGSSLWFVTDDVTRTINKVRSIGYHDTDKTVMTYRIKTTVQPRPLTTNWPPNTVADILDWQGTLDIRCKRKIHERILEGYKKKNSKGVLIIIESPLMTYGFTVFYERHSTYKGQLKALRDLSYKFRVLPISVVRIDDQYVAQRNAPKSKTLAGKNLAIVGCGTIGGYLSDMLVKAGAGTGGGKLTLIDFDRLFPQNLGRHRLGFPDILINKAEAMAKELRRISPGAEINALPVDVRQAQLGELDLLIDATGEESLGHWLSGHYPLPLHMLSIWIEGPGIAVRALLRTNTSGACFRCLFHSNRRRELCSTLDPIPTILAGHGCEGLYVPFPASVSVQAASLGAEVINDWVNDKYSPALRTKLIDSEKQLATPDCDPLRDKECPICNS
ncbi:ThiF family adenylyltransferase [Marinomonas polaris]|uniref:ThiF family adenylyltransferase n=1 Tax=Marinomonas polaris TaxID=293552 RepID=UPI00351140E8